jgi:hypothetical protein
MRLLHGVGRLEKGTYLAHCQGKQTREYRLWQAMLARCYSEYLQERYPTYKGCAVSENFKNFQYFAEWCNTQKGFSELGWHLDKDFIGDGKLYSEDTCVFIPTYLNMLNTKIYNHYFEDKRCKYEVRLSYYGRTKYIGSYESKEDAENAYNKAKTSYVSEMLSKLEGAVDSRVLVQLKRKYNLWN